MVQSDAAPMPAMESPVERVASGDKAFESESGVSSEQVQEFRKVIYSADMTLIVADTEVTAESINQLATDLGGYIANLNAFRSDNLLYYSITLRIPAEQFDNARAALRNLAVRSIAIRSAPMMSPTSTSTSKRGCAPCAPPRPS